MGLLDKFSRPPPPTAAGLAEDSHTVPADNIATRAPQQLDHVAPDAIDPAVEKSLIRKLDLHLVPLVSALYLLAYLDRSNIGNAKIAGMTEDLSMTSDSYAWLLTIFYISYICFEFFALMWKLVPPHMWAAFVVLGWGVAATAQAGATSWRGMMAARFFLGLFEAGFGPGIPYLLSFYYLRDELGLRCGLFVSAAPLATCFAGALAYGITSGTPAIANWRLLFLVEGLPTLLMAAVAWFCLPDSPAQARFLTPEEKAVAKARGVRQVGDEEAQRIGHLSWPDILAALLDLKNWITALMYFSCNVSFSSLPVFLPTIIAEMGFSPIDAQGLSAPPYFLSFLLVIATTYAADRTAQRGATIAFLSLVAFAGYTLLATTSATAPRYTGVFLAAAGVFPCIGNILPWVLNNQGSDTRRGVGIALLNLVGQCGPLLGTRVFPAGDGPYYRTGMWVCAGFMALNGGLAVLLRALLGWENGRRDARYGAVVREREGEEGEGEKGGGGGGEENEGPGFRYIL